MLLTGHLPKSIFKNIRVYGIMHNWEAYLISGPFKVRKMIHWSPHLGDVLKFNVDGCRYREAGTDRDWCGPS